MQNKAISKFPNPSSSQCLPYFPSPNHSCLLPLPACRPRSHLVSSSFDLSIGLTLPPAFRVMDEQSQILPSEEEAIAVASQHATDYLRGAVHDFQQDARDLFYTCHTGLIQSLCKYSLLKDRAELLSRRLELDLDIILASLPQKKHKNSVHREGDSLRLQKAKEILWRIDSVLPTLPLWNRQLIPSLFESSLTADEFANALRENMQSVLQSIPFTEYLKWIGGGQSEAIISLLSFISHIRDEFRDRLSDPDARILIEEINKVWPPFYYRAITLLICK